MPELEPLKRSGSNDFSQPKRFLVEPLLAFVQLPERCAETVQFSANQFERFLSGSLLASILLVVIGVEQHGAKNGEKGFEPRPNAAELEEQADQQFFDRKEKSRFWKLFESLKASND